MWCIGTFEYLGYLGHLDTCISDGAAISERWNIMFRSLEDGNGIYGSLLEILHSSYCREFDMMRGDLMVSVYIIPLVVAMDFSTLIVVYIGFHISTIIPMDTEGIPLLVADNNFG